jgi:hypothetical protein
MVPLRKAMAAEILGTVDEVGLWGQLLSCDDPRIRLDCLKYLTDRRDGKAPLSVPSEGPAISFVVRSILDKETTPIDSSPDFRREVR